MNQKGYTAEAKYLGVICNWRRTCDEHGLSNEARKQFNHEFLSYILDEMMPWHTEKDFSHQEVNR